MQDKLVALVTGANKGIGLQIAKDLAAKGLIVLVGSRDLAAGSEAAKRVGANAHAIQLDVTAQASISAAAERITSEFGRLDVLVNNAGISQSAKARSMQADKPLAELAKGGLLTVVPIDEMRAIWDTNVFGVVAVTQAMLPLLREAPAGRIVNVGSTVGSLTLNSDTASPYRAMFGAYSTSKTAVNAITVAFAASLQDTRIKVNAACPGFTGTALNNFAGTRSVEEGAGEPVRLALLDDNGPTGTYSDENGPIPW